MNDDTVSKDSVEGTLRPAADEVAPADQIGRSVDRMEAGIQRIALGLDQNAMDLARLKHLLAALDREMRRRYF